MARGRLLEDESVKEGEAGDDQKKQEGGVKGRDKIEEGRQESEGKEAIKPDFTPERKTGGHSTPEAGHLPDHHTPSQHHDG